MQIFVDADACPAVAIVEKVAKMHAVPVTLLCDTNHVLSSGYSKVIVVGAGADAVDYKLNHFRLYLYNIFFLSQICCFQFPIINIKHRCRCAHGNGISNRFCQVNAHDNQKSPSNYDSIIV